ncbi:MAG: hypothetical protein AB9921_05915 [Erysipelotrichaceae bacterium]
MKLNRRLSILSLTAALAVLVIGCTLTSTKTCVPDGTKVCFDKTKQTYRIEDGAKIVVEVPTKEYGDRLVALFDATHQETPGLLSYVVGNVSSDITPDLKFMSQNEAALNYASLLVLDESMNDLLLNNLQWDKSEEVNLEGLRFVPMSATGFTFVYDETVLNDLGVSLEDVDADGLPDAIDTVDEITTVASKYLAQDVKRTYTSVFPLAFNEALSFYPFLTAGGWEIFPEDIATEPGFETPEFLEALTLIEKLGASTIVAQRPVDPVKLVWQFDQVLSGKEFLFSMASEWMYVEAYENRTKHNVRYARFPALEDQILTPLVSVEGYVIQNTAYPSAAHEVLRVIREVESLNAFTATVKKTLLVHPTLVDQVTYPDAKQQELAKAYVHSQSFPLIALEGNPKVLGFTMYRQMEILPVLKRLFLQEITAEQAQNEIVLLSIDWISNNLGYPAEVIKTNE